MFEFGLGGFYYFVARLSRLLPYPTGHDTQKHEASGAGCTVRGQVVIAPPSIVDGYEYKPVKLQMPHLLTPDNERQLHAFLESVRPGFTKTLTKPHTDPS